MKKSYLIGGILLTLLCIGGALYLFIPMFDLVDRTSQSVTSTSPISIEYVPKSTGREVGAGSKEYYSSEYNFSLLYPDALSVKEFSEAGGAMTITFEQDDGKTLSGFQIFIVPFSGAQITEERFKQDNPSGVRKNLKDIMLDGATGASFYSTNATLGDTAEVWFVRGGYLYEVTTFKELDTWLADILSAWRFVK